MAKPEDMADILDLLEEGETGDDETLNIEDGGDDGEDGAGDGESQNQEGQKAGQGDDPGDGGEGGNDAGAGAGEEDKPAVTQPPAAQENRNPFQIPANAQERMTAIESEMADVEKQWDAGDIGDAEFKRRIKELNTEAADIAARVQATNLVNTQRENDRIAADDRAWAKSVDGFKKDNPALWEAGHRPRFNEHVKAVTADARYQGLSFDQQLALAANFYRSELTALGREAPAVKIKKGAAADPAAPKQDKIPDRPPLPPSLGKRPAAAINDNDSPFANIEALERRGDVDGAEAAIAALSPAMRDAYLQGTDIA